MTPPDASEIVRMLAAIQIAMADNDAHIATCDAKGVRPDPIELLQGITIMGTQLAKMLGEITGGRCWVAASVAYVALGVLEYATALDGDAERLANLQPALDDCVDFVIGAANEPAPRGTADHGSSGSGFLN